jgi:hypothetical protein
MGDRTQLNVRLDARTEALLAYLEHRLNINATAVARLALLRLALQEGWTEAATPPP